MRKNSKPGARPAVPNRGNRYPDEIRAEAVRRVLEVGESVVMVAHSLGVGEASIKNWLKEIRRASGETGRVVRTFSDDERANAIERVRIIGVKSAAEELGIGEWNLYDWSNAAGVSARSKRGVRPPAEADKEFIWISDEYPQLEEWRVLGARWILEQGAGIRPRLLSLRKFFKDFLIGQVESRGISLSPSILLSRTTLLPHFYPTCLAGLEVRVATTSNNYVHEFLEWVLLTTLSLPDDHDRPIIGNNYHNPVTAMRRDGSTHRAESVRSPLPYGYIDDLRSMLASGAHFGDWKWAQSALGSEFGRMGTPAPDWFEVTESQIDKGDPDCVWRLRPRSSGRGGPLLEMWSPVRWVALLLKLALPLRTIQVCLLDSGEADTWRYDGDGNTGKWSLSESRLSEGTERKPLRQGVFRRNAPAIPEAGGPQVQLYINTNKTADAQKSGAEKGYILTWSASGPLHGNPFYWICKLRNWQGKYNPIQSRTSWSELDASRIDAKSELQLAGFPDACFLFRSPEMGARFAHLPISRSLLDTPWYRLLEAFQQHLAKRGERHSDGSGITLVVGDSRTTTHFPLHSLRVSLITALALEGKVPFPILQKLVGHSRLLMTLYYTKPGAAFIHRELEEATKRLEEAKDRNVVEFLRDTEHNQMLSEAIANSSNSLALAVPEHPAARNPAGWMLMHHGLCLVGGNTTQMDGNNSIGGCHNGGPNLSSDANPRYTPVPGGARNCVRCRWFVTRAHYMPALVAHLNVIFYHYDEARNACVVADRNLGSMKAQREAGEREGLQFDGVAELRKLQRIYETAMQRFSDLAEDAAACARLISRCQEQLNSEGIKSGTSALITVGTIQDLEVAIEEVDSELLQLAGVCAAAEVYPDLAPGKAVFRRSQLLDAALLRDGLPPIFLTLSEEEQLRAGNSFMSSLAREFNPDSPALGQRQVVAMIDAQESLSEHLGLDLRGLLAGKKSTKLAGSDVPVMVGVGQ
jgi:transposase-like protein